MATETLFLHPSSLQVPSFNHATRGAGALTIQGSNILESSSILSASEARSLVNGGVTRAVATAAAGFNSEFAAIFNDNRVFNEGGVFQGEAFSEAELISTYDIQQGETLSFDFDAGFNLEATEIERTDKYLSLVKQEVGFLVLDLTSGNASDQNIDPLNPQVIGYFGLEGQLESGVDGAQSFDSTLGNGTIISDSPELDIDGDNGIDFVRSSVSGQFSHDFESDTKIALVKVTSSFIRTAGDGTLDLFDPDVITGTIGNDLLRASANGSKIYASLGDDSITGSRRTDTFEGGRGNDRLAGFDGDDRLNGGADNDHVDGGRGNDLVVGGTGQDLVLGGHGNDTLIGIDPLSVEVGRNEVDILTGGRGRDRFVLGDDRKAFYQVDGDRNYALITDFRRGGGDQILLHGQASDYDIEYVRRFPNGLPVGSRIYYTAGSGRELVGIVQNTNLEGRLSDSSLFAYNQNVIA